MKHHPRPFTLCHNNILSFFNQLFIIFSCVLKITGMFRHHRLF